MTEELSPENNNQATVWALPWYITLIYVAIVIYTLVTAPPLNPFKILGATFVGFIGGALGGALGGIFSFLYQKYAVDPSRNLQWLTFLLIGAGFLIVQAIEAGILLGAGSIIRDKEFMGFAAIGMGSGMIAGLLPQYGLRTSHPNFAALSYWICTVMGAFGGAFIAVPTAILLYGLGRLRYI